MIGQAKNDEKILYWKHKANIEDALRQKEYDKEEAYKKGYEKGLKIGKLKAEIHKIQSMFKLGIAQEKFIPKLEFLTQEPLKAKLDENLNYIKEHLDYSEDQICSDLNLLGYII